jgi:hypothetical protein
LRDLAKGRSGWEVSNGGLFNPSASEDMDWKRANSLSSNNLTFSDLVPLILSTSRSNFNIDFGTKRFIQLSSDNPKSAVWHISRIHMSFTDFGSGGAIDHETQSRIRSQSQRNSGNVSSNAPANLDRTLAEVGELLTKFQVSAINT